MAQVLEEKQKRAVAENILLQKQLKLVQDDFKVFTMKITERMKVPLKEKRALTNRYTVLQAEHERLEAEIKALKDSFVPFDDSTLTDAQKRERAALITTIRRFEAERKLIHEKVKEKLKRLVLARYEASLRLKYLQKQRIDPLELQRLRKKVSSLLEEKTNLTQEYTAVVGRNEGDKYRAQSLALKRQITNADANLDLMRKKKSTLEERVKKNEDDKASYAATMEELRAREAELKAAIAVEEDSQQNVVQYEVQNNYLMNEIANFHKENARLSAIVEDAAGAASDRQAEFSELERQRDMNESAIDELKQAIEAMSTETAELEEELKFQEEKVAAAVAERTVLRLQINRLRTRSEELSASTAKMACALPEEMQAKTNALLELEELIGELKKVDDIDRQNDELRMNLQECLDQNQQLISRIEQLTAPEPAPESDSEDEEEEVMSMLEWAGRMMGIGRFRKRSPSTTGRERSGTGSSPGPSPLAAGSPPPSSPLRDAGSPTVNEPASPAGSSIPPGSSPPPEGPIVGSPDSAAQKLQARHLLERRASAHHVRSPLENKVRSSTNAAELERMLGDQHKGVDDMLSGIQAQIEHEVAVAEKEKRNSVALGLRPRSGTAISEFVDDNTIQYLPKGNNAFPPVRCATVERLVERLTYEKFPDPDFVQAFMLTYRSFTTPTELLELLIQRYCIVPPPDADAGKLAVFKKTKLIPIRLRVLTALKQWVDKMPTDFAEDEQLNATLSDFLEEVMPATGMARAAEQLKRVLEQRLQDKKDMKEATKAKAEEFAALAVEPALPAQSILQLDPEAIAAQMTLIEHNLYCAIELTECLNSAWQAKDKNERAPNIVACIERFNIVSSWVYSEVVQDDLRPRDRAKFINWMIKLGVAFQNLNNFNGVMEVVAGLSNISVSRLQKTWAKVDSKMSAQYASMKDLVSNKKSYKTLRSRLRLAQPPCVPYLGIYLTYLTQAEVANPNKVDGMINFVKRQLISTVIHEIQNYQMDEYKVEPDPNLLGYIMNLPFISDDDAYDLSIAAEPLRNG